MSAQSEFNRHEKKDSEVQKNQTKKEEKTFVQKLDDIFSEDNLLGAGYALLGVGFVAFAISIIFPNSMLIAQITLGSWGLGLASICVGGARAMLNSPTRRLKEALQTS